MEPHPFTYHIGTKTKTIKVKPLTTIFQKALGLMFKSQSPPLLFIFKREQPIAIHSLFCKPFVAIWLDKNKKATKVEKIKNWRFHISGRGKYLLELPINKQ